MLRRGSESRRVRFSTRLNFEETILMMSFEASKIPRKLFLLGLLQARLIRKSSLPWTEVYAVCRCENIVDCGEVNGMFCLDLSVPPDSVKLLTELEDVQEIK